jgi:hypothetical protein
MHGSRRSRKLRAARRKVPAIMRVLRALIMGRLRLVFIMLATRRGSVVVPGPETKKVMT